MEDTRKFLCVNCFDEYPLSDMSSTHLCVKCIGRKVLQSAKRAGESTPREPTNAAKKEKIRRNRKCM